MQNFDFWLIAVSFAPPWSPFFPGSHRAILYRHKVEYSQRLPRPLPVPVACFRLIPGVGLVFPPCRRCLQYKRKKRASQISPLVQHTYVYTHHCRAKLASKTVQLIIKHQVGNISTHVGYRPMFSARVSRVSV